MAYIRKLLVLSAVLWSLSLASNALEVTHDGRGLILNGDRKLILSGSIHYPRSTPSMWPSLMKKAKLGGLNTIETYVFWNAHEPQRRQYDFSGNLDLVRFIKTIQEAGMYAILRIGPYVCAEWNYGGFPVWLHNMPGIKFRTKNDVFMNEMKTFTTLIVDMIKRENLFASQGGPIILAQIENEYGNVMGPYGDEGKQYVEWCADLAQGYKLGIPWIMCQQGNAPAPMINTCNGWYCDKFYPNNPNSPKIWTENWTGWFKGWGKAIPHRTAEDLAFSVARFFQYGGSVHNYYMYHGGTNFGRTAGGPYITTSYDYDAPLDEYGTPNEPKYGHLKELHHHLMKAEKMLTEGKRRDIDYGSLMQATVFSLRGKRVCFFGNANTTHDHTIDFEGNSYTIPAWSLSIVHDCYREVYNTARVNAETSIKRIVSNDADDGAEPYELKWVWKSERLERVKDDGSVDGAVRKANKLLDQKKFNDTSDYLWYFTSFHVKKTDPLWGKHVTFHVHTNGRVLHAFFNDKFIGTKFSHGEDDFVFEQRVKLKKGLNKVALLSATVGLANYGPFFDEAKAGIHGPVKLIGRKAGSDDVVKNITSHKWSYKVGLDGEKKGFYEVNTPFKKWYSGKLPADRMFMWYKTTFQAPLGNDPVVADLLGMGKGEAWVNGHSIGRFWPSFKSNPDACSIEKCDYRGPYSDKKCLSDCGKPSQRWYHVPRDFLKDDNNQLVLFEELGGNPSYIQFGTVQVEKLCANAYEGGVLQLSCHEGKRISEIKFASFGEPKGSCGEFEKNRCDSQRAFHVIKGKCLGKQYCAIHVDEDTLGSPRCRGNTYRLAVEAIC